MTDKTPTANHGGGFLRLRHILGDGKANPPIKARIPVSKSTWYAGVQLQKFPKPVHLGRCAMWREADIARLEEAIAQGELTL